VGAVTAVAGIGGLLGAVLARRVIRRLGSARVLWVTKLWFTGAAVLLPLARPHWDSQSRGHPA
jgi:predicted MFS family arabinose efflux permease